MGSRRRWLTSRRKNGSSRRSTCSPASQRTVQRVQDRPVAQTLGHAPTSVM